MARHTRAFALSPVVLVALAGALGLGLAVGCHAGASSGKDTTPNAHPLYPDHQSCDVTSGSAERIDGNNDGRADIVIVHSGARTVCRAEDLNLDGVMDRYVYFDDAGRIRRIESDYDRDGRVDEIATFRDGVVARKDRELNLDGKLDTWETYQNGKIATRERDTLGDGRVHQWWAFPDPTKPECAIVVSDIDGSGRPDPGSKVDLCHPDTEPPSIIATASASVSNAPASAPPAVPPAPGAPSGSARAVAAAPRSSSGAPPAGAAGAAGR